MSSHKPTEEELLQGYQECKDCGGILLLEAGYEVPTSSCTRCGEHVVSKEEFLKPLNGVYIL